MAPEDIQCHETINVDELLCGSTASPKHVMDVSLIELSSDTICRSQEALNSIMLPSKSSMESVTTEDTDDESSFSSQGTGDRRQGHLGRPKRSIFAPYWNKTGEEPSLKRPSTSSATKKSLPREIQTPSVKKADTSANTTTHEPTNRRRSILTNKYMSQSVPSLARSSAVPVLTRRASSTSSLQPGFSCLRESRYSGPKRRKSHSDVSVSFATKIDVRHFDPPQEVWSHDGWSSFFH